MMVIQIPPLRGFNSISLEGRGDARYEAVDILFMFISGPDVSTQLQSGHSSVLGWFGVAVAVLLPPQYSHTGLYWVPPGAWNRLHPQTAPYLYPPPPVPRVIVSYRSPRSGGVGDGGTSCRKGPLCWELGWG